MAVKKRAGLRDKVAARANTSKDNTSSAPQYDLPEDPKAFLHVPKETKKDKLENKRNQFLSRLSDKSGDKFAGISKSSIRRRKRKQKDELLPKMQDLLTSLDDTTKPETHDDLSSDKPNELLKNINIVDSKSVKFIQTKKENKNIPNPKNKSGIKLIESQERSRFEKVLKDTNFKKSPFASLRENIQNRLKTENL